MKPINFCLSTVDFFRAWSHVAGRVLPAPKLMLCHVKSVTEITNLVLQEPVSV